MEIFLILLVIYLIWGVFVSKKIYELNKEHLDKELLAAGISNKNLPLAKRVLFVSAIIFWPYFFIRN